MSDDHPYRAPVSNVVAEQLPPAFAQGPLSVAKLKAGVVLSIAYAVLTIPLTVMSFLYELQSDNLPYTIATNVLSTLSLILWIYLILLFKSFANLRFEFHKADRFIYISIGLSILLWLLTSFMGPMSKATTEIKIADYVVLSLYGIFGGLFGWRLRLMPYYRGVKLFAWINIVMGALTATVVLMLLLIPLNLAYGIVMAMIFSAAASELSLGQT